MYSVNVRALDNEHVDNLDIAPETSAGLGTDNVEEFTWNPDPSEYATHSSSSWLATAPDNSSDTNSYSASVSTSLGANVGFFGKEGTGGQFIQHSTRL